MSSATQSELIDSKLVAGHAQRLLRKSAYKQLHRIECELIDGTLFLRGQVTSFYLKQIAQQSVRELNGVGRIYNFVQVVGEPVH